MLRDASSGTQREVHPAGVFVFIGSDAEHRRSSRAWSTSTSAASCSPIRALQTSVPGIFAAGDCRAGSTKQAASAAGEGAAVALAIRRYVEPLSGGSPTSEDRSAESTGRFDTCVPPAMSARAGTASPR